MARCDSKIYIQKLEHSFSLRTEIFVSILYSHQNLNKQVALLVIVKSD